MSDDLSTAPSSTSSGMLVLPREFTDIKTPTPLSITPLSLPSSSSSTLSCQVHLISSTCATTTCPKPLALVELHKYSPSFGSWIVVPSDESQHPRVLDHGSLTFMTKIDPLFIALILLDSIDRADVFQPATELLTLASNQAKTDLSLILDDDQLSLLCDMKKISMNYSNGNDDQQSFFRLSNEKVDKWLLKKYQNLCRTDVHMHKKERINLVTHYLTKNRADKFQSFIMSNNSAINGHTHHVNDNENDQGHEGETHVENDENQNETIVKQTDTEAAGLAMSVMYSEANINNSLPDYIPSSSTTKTTATRKQPVRKTVPVNTSAQKFWASQQQGNNKSKGTTKKRKRPTK